MIVTGFHWWWVNIASGNGLVPSGNKPLPEPMLTQIGITRPNGITRPQWVNATDISGLSYLIISQDYPYLELFADFVSSESGLDFTGSFVDLWVVQVNVDGLLSWLVLTRGRFGYGALWRRCSENMLAQSQSCLSWWWNDKETLFVFARCGGRVLKVPDSGLQVTCNSATRGLNTSAAARHLRCRSKQVA